MSYEPESWIEAARDSVAAQDPAVLVSIVGVQGSSPREPGARMLVRSDSVVDSVGGGVLEYMAIQRARADMRDGRPERRLLSFPLDRDSQQCCGGIVVLLFEPLFNADAQWLQQLSPIVIDQGALLVTALGDSSEKRVVTKDEQQNSAPSLPKAISKWQTSRTGPDACLIDDQNQKYLCEFIIRPRFNVLLFGAGHVGRALVRALAPHQCQLLWVDSREQEFPAEIPGNVTALISTDVGQVISAAAAGSYLLIMTHRHPLDFEICELALARGDFGLVGLIGSATKRRRFTRAMARAGLATDLIAKLCCPIGVPGIHGKQPAVVAASVVAQLLQLHETGADHAARRVGISEKQAEASPISGSF